MTNRERFQRVMQFGKADRLPMLEWAGWWDQTLARWHGEGLPRELTDAAEIRKYLGQDEHHQWWVPTRGPACPRPAGHGQGLIRNRDDYLAIKEHLYPERAFDPEVIQDWAKRQQQGDLIIWISLDGFFWFPRALFGIEPHLYALYDQPELVRKINEDLVAFHFRVLEELCRICTPDFMTFAEDMSYNHGPMLSKAQFDEFMAPYYHKITTWLLERDIIPFVDTDGDVTEPASWFEEVGVLGFLPLERMAGVNVVALRRDHPQLRMIGAFDKTVMHLGEAHIRQEFERLLPVMKQGGYIPSVDHQTPPGVSLEDYHLWMRLLREYCERAMA